MKTLRHTCIAKRLFPLLFFVLSISLGTASAFEQDQRATSLKMEFGTDAFAPQNAFGGALVADLLRQQLQSALDSSVASGSTSLMFEFLNLGDLTGTNNAVFSVGVVNGLPVIDAGNPTTYSGTSDRDWWYRAIPNQTNPAGVPLNQLSAQITANVLTAGPGRISFASLIPGTPGLVMSGTSITATTGASTHPLISANGFAPGHLPSENLDPALISFETMTGGKLKGNISAAALAAVPLPSNIASLPFSPYTTSNSMLDLLVGGFTLPIVGDQVKATQPDTFDASASVGAGGPYTFTVDANKKVTGCKDKNGAAVDLTLGLNAAAYSSYFTFTAGRVFVLPPAPEISVEQPSGTNLIDGGTKEFGNVTAGTNATRTFFIRNVGNLDLTGLAVSIDGADAAAFTLTANPAGPVTPLGNTSFDVQFSASGTGIKTANIHINSNDANENPFDIVVTANVILPNAAPTDIALSALALPEVQPIGTVVGTFTTTDPDALNTFTYTLVAGMGGDDNASFSISGDGLKTAAIFDFETKSTYHIRVKSTDQGSLSVEKTFTITITDLVELPPVFASDPTATPNPTLVKIPVSFSAAATSATPLTVTWSFGDGTSATGATVLHTYTIAATFSVSVTATNSTGSVTKNLNVTVLEAQSIPPDKASLKFNFKKPNDTLTISGPLTVPTDFQPSGKSMTVLIGNFSKTLTLSDKGKSTGDKSNAFSITGKIKKGVFTSTVAKLSISLKKQDLYTPLTGFGFTNGNVKTPVAVEVTAMILIDGKAFTTKPVFLYTAKAGASGAGKFKK